MKLKHVAIVALDGTTGDAWMVRSGELAGSLSYLPLVNSWAITIKDNSVFRRETLFEVLEQAVAMEIIRPHGSFRSIIGEHVEDLELADLDGLVIGLESTRPDIEHG